MTTQDRAIEMAGKGFEDFTSEQMAEVLESAELAQGFQITRANVFQMSLNGARVQRRNIAEMAALSAKGPQKWVEKDLPAFEYRAEMYGSARMADTNDQPEGYQGD